MQSDERQASVGMMSDWSNVHDECMLCEMEKRTKWYLETDDFVIAEKLSGGPFIVLKDHEEELSDEEWEDAEETVGLLYDDFSLDVRMGMVPDHWHAHIVRDGSIDLSGE